MFKKFLFPTLLLGIFSFGISHADWREDENGRSIAQKYLESNKNDDFWKDNSPKLGEGTPLYMEKETPSYVEYQVVCEKNLSCGFIIVNVDGDDVDIPIASPSDTPPSQILTQKSGTLKTDLQFYYFSPFDIYSKNTVTNQINAIDPQIDPATRNDFPKDMEEQEKQQIQQWIRVQQIKVPEDFRKQLHFWKEYKRTSDFQKAKEFIINSDFNTPSTPGGSTWRYVPGESSWNCNSRVPCYEQYPYWYNWNYCNSGCSPVAAAIIFGYHDKMGHYSNLLKGKIAPMTNSEYYPFESNPTPKSMIDEIRGHMGTFCDNGEGSTDRDNIPNGKQYAIDVGYTSATSGQAYTIIQIPMRIPLEIDARHPVLLSINKLDETGGHSVVAYGYNVSNPNEVRINAGWGNGKNSNTNIQLFNITNIKYSDENIASLKTTARVTWYRFQ